MAGKSAILVVRIITDAKDAAKGVDQAQGKFAKIGKAAAVAGAAAGVAVAAFAVKAVKSASDVQQAYGAVDNVFGKTASRIKTSAAGAADSVGLAASQYAQMAAVLGAQLGNMGVAADQLAPTTEKLISLGADLSAQFGGSSADAVEALSSLLRGERDPIEKYGVSINQAAINAQLAAKGQDKLKGSALKAAQTQATLALVMKQTASSAGQFAKEAGTVAGAQEIANANFENASAALGQVLLPIFAKFATILASVARWVTQNSTTVTILVTVLAALAAITVAVTAATAAWGAVTTVATGIATGFRIAMFILNTVIAANPIGALVTGIILLIGVVVILWNKFPPFRNLVLSVFAAISAAVRGLIDWIGPKLGAAFRFAQSVASVVFSAIRIYVQVYITVISTLVGWIRNTLVAAFNTLKSVAITAFNVLKAPAEAIISIFQRLWSIIQKVIDIIGRIHIPSLPSWIPGIGGASASVSSPAPALASRTAGLGRAGLAVPFINPTRRVGAVAGGAGVVININGALDPHAVARQIRTILRTDQRLTGLAQVL